MSESLTSNAESDKWVNRIHVAWGKAAQGIIETGREFIDAKEAVGQENFATIIERSGFSRSTVVKLMAIAKSFSNCSHVNTLPSSWGTLYELTKLGDNLQLAIDQGRITPELQRSEVKQLLLSYEQPSPAAAEQEPKPVKPASNAESSNSEKQLSVEREQIKPSAEIDITLNKLFPSLTNRQKQKLVDEFHTAVNARVKEFLAETIGPQLRKEQKEAQFAMRNRKGVFNKKTYNNILACLHPDWVTDPSQKRHYEVVFHSFKEKEKQLLSENESPTKYTDIPTTVAEWEERKRQATAARKAKRAASKGGIEPQH